MEHTLITQHETINLVMDGQNGEAEDFKTALQEKRNSRVLTKWEKVKIVPLAFIAEAQEH